MLTATTTANTPIPAPAGNPKGKLMVTTTSTTVPPSVEVQAHAARPLGRIRDRGLAVLAFLTVLVLTAGPANASTPTDPLNGGGDTIFSTLTSFIQTSLVGKVFALAVVSIAVGMVLKWVKKAVNA